MQSKNQHWYLNCFTLPYILYLCRIVEMVLQEASFKQKTQGSDKSDPRSIYQTPNLKLFIQIFLKFLTHIKVGM